MKHSDLIHYGFYNKAERIFITNKQGIVYYLPSIKIAKAQLEHISREFGFSFSEEYIEIRQF